VSQWTGIPVHSLDHEEKEKLVHLADRLHERVVGQDEAVNLVAQAVLRVTNMAPFMPFRVILVIE